MDETRRILRFIIPGALFGILLLILLLLLAPCWTLATLKTISKDAGIGFAIAGLAGTGAIGYLLSAIHHQLHWWLRKSWLSTIDHTECVRQMLRDNKLVMTELQADGSVKNLKAEEVDRKLAHGALSALWYQRLGQEPIKSADAKAQGMSDQAHSLGIARAGAICAFLLSFGVACFVSRCTLEVNAVFRSVLAIVIGVGSILLFWAAYLRVGRMAQVLIEQLLLAAVGKPPQPLEIQIAPWPGRPRNKAL